MVKMNASDFQIGVDSKTMQYAIQKKVGELFDNAYNFSEVMRIIANETAKKGHSIAIVRSVSYWNVGIAGTWHEFNTYGEAFKFALETYVEKEIEKRLASL